MLGSDNWNVAYGDMSSDVSEVQIYFYFGLSELWVYKPGIFSPACRVTLCIVA